MNSRVVMLPGRGGRLRPVRMGGRKGMADVIACLPPGGRYAAFEIKRYGQRATPEQRAFLDSVKKAGGIGEVIYDIKELEKALAC